MGPSLSCGVNSSEGNWVYDWMEWIYDVGHRNIDKITFTIAKPEAWAPIACLAEQSSAVGQDMIRPCAGWSKDTRNTH